MPSARHTASNAARSSSGRFTVVRIPRRDGDGTKAPGHGWPVAAAYALDRSRRFAAGLVAGLVIGVGHLVSSIAVVAVFLLAASYFDVTQLGWVRYVAGVLLIALGARESDPDRPRGSDGRSAQRRDPDGSHDHHDHHDHAGDSPHHALGADDPRGLAGLASAAFFLGFAHEEEFEILAFCTGAPGHCLPLMLVYATAVIVALVALTLLLVAGFERYEDRVGRYAAYLPTLSAVVLVAMGVGFLLGVV